MVEVLTALIWAVALTTVALAALFYLGRPARRALEAMATSRVANEGDRELAREQKLLQLEERRVQLEKSRGVLEDEIAAAIAKLRAETADYEVEAKAADGALADAVEAKRRVAAARADAEARLAEEFARANHKVAPSQPSREMMEGYTRACSYYLSQGTDIPTLGEWLKS
ncbi:MAG: hypothetical protein JWN01_714 [Patescibacteria group bacterium]|nr:hypothetical protein [Patescibacteria group bacterium]